MSKYQPFQEEQVFQGSNFHIDSPTKQNKFPDDSPERTKKSVKHFINHHTEMTSVEKAMHHEEIGLEGKISLNIQNIPQKIGYEPNKIPPNWRLAEKHAVILTRKIFLEKDIKSNRFPGE